MFSQFQARFPTGSLVSELLHIHDGHYVVKVMIQLGGVTLATGMSAADTIEQAEDQARIRALTVLGLEPPAYESQAHLMGHQSPARLNPSQVFAREASESTLVGHSDWTPGLAAGKQPESAPEKPTESVPELSTAEESPLDSASELELTLETHSPTPAPTPNLDLAQSGQNGSGRRSPAAPSPPPISAPVDLSDVIAQTSVELKRLGWTNAEGRDYLQQTYGKRSRQQLTDQELMDFLQHLQSQPPVDEPSF